MRLFDALRDWRVRRSVPYTCRHVVELMTDYLEGALLPEERQKFEAHIEHCEACVRYLDQLRVTVDVLARVQPDDPDPEVREQLLEFYRRYRSV